MKNIIFIGRLQPFHLAHFQLLKNALNLDNKNNELNKLIIVLGSSFQKRSLKNPFTWQERSQMIINCFDEKEKKQISFIPVADFNNDELWANEIKNQVLKLNKNNKKNQKFYLIGHFKDESSYYLNIFPEWQLIKQENFYNLDATAVRNIYFNLNNLNDENINNLNKYVPENILIFLKEWQKTDNYKVIQKLWIEQNKS